MDIYINSPFSAWPDRRLYLFMTGVEADRFVEVLLLGRRVKAHVGAFVEQVPHLAMRHRLPGYEELGIDILEIPVERLALQLVAQGDPGGDVAVVAQVVADPVVVVLFVFIKPHLGQPNCVSPTLAV